jgi:hypothetical protein
MADYMQYLTGVDLDSDDTTANEFDNLIGAKPFGKGLLTWLNKSAWQATGDR